MVVYPIAAFEQHGPHLPFITDTAEAQSIVDQLNAVITDHVLCLPAQWLGYSLHHINFKSTVTAKSETHINMYCGDSELYGECGLWTDLDR